MWSVMPIFELGWAIPVISHVWKFGLDWFKSKVCEFFGGQKPPLGGVICDMWCPSSNLAELFQSKVTRENLARIGRAFQELLFPQTNIQKNGLNFIRIVGVNFPGRGGGGQNPPIIGVTCDLQCPSSNLAELFQSKVVWKFGSDWLSFSRVIVITNKNPWGQKPPIRGVTFDLWSLFLNSDELFQSKFMCENLLWIGWNRGYVNFEERQKPPIRRGYMWPAMPICEFGRAFPVQSHVWKFGSYGWAFQELSW